jgi:hypothetical protein
MRGRTGFTYGGQAVLEGVMIRGQRHIAVAVRRPDNTIASTTKPLNPMFTGKLRRLPLVRGVIALIETLALGAWALNYSAAVNLEAEGEEMSKGAMAMTLGVSLLFAVGLFFVLPVFASRPFEGYLGSNLVSNIAEGAIRMALFLAYILLIGRMRDIRRVFMYHGAEHMTVHAQERGLTLEPDNVRRFSTAHPRCGTAFLLVVMVVAIIAFVFVGREPLWWLVLSRIVLVPVVAAVAYEILRLSGRYADNPLVRIITGPSLALQSLTTRQPEDGQIEIAIEAMRIAIAADAGEPVSEADSHRDEEPRGQAEPETP